jgi:hypothetical protein
MKNLILLIIFVLPMALFSGAPSCLDGMEVSLVDCNGRVIKTGKLNSQGRLELSGAKDVCWDIKLTNNGKSVVLGVNNTKGKKNNPIHNPKNTSGENPLYQSKISDIKGGSELLKSNHEAAHIVQQKNGSRSEASLEETNNAERVQGNINTSRANIKNKNKRNGISGEGFDNDCDDNIEISITSIGKGRIKISCITLKR